MKSAPLVLISHHLFPIKFFALMKHPYLATLLCLLLLAGFGFPSGAFAQTGSVSGRVTDAKNEGIPGATVLVEGTSLGGSSNVDGTYSIQNVPAGAQTLVVSFVGYNSMRLPVTVAAGQTATASASLSENATQLAEAVVVGYGTQRRQDVTGSIATVDTRQFVKGQVTTPEQLIQGKIAGVSITSNNGLPGSGSTIRIRGGSSLTASNDPLIVIDGVPVSNGGIAGAPNPLSLINPADIESYTVLKDASATAIYGARASNGVILITTKKGVQGDKMRVAFNSLFSVSQRAKKLDVLTGDEYRALIKGQGYRTAVGDITPVGTPSRDTLLGTANTDWQNEIYRSALTFDNNISLTGSAGKVPFRVSYGNLNQQGIIRTSELQRNTLSVGVSPVLFGDRLRIDVNLKGSQAKNRFADGGVVYGAAAFDPTLPVRSSDPRFAPFGGYYEILQGTGIPEALSPANPVSLLEARRDVSTVYRSIGNVQLDLKIPGVEGLSANYNVGYDFQRGTGSTTVDPRSRAGFRSLTNDSLNGNFRRYSENRNSWLNEAFLKYTRDFDKFGRIDVLAGYSYQNFYRFNPNSRDTYANGVLLPAATAAAQPYSSDENALQSVYGRLNYSLLNRYLLTATLRRDESSQFAPELRAGYFPAVSLGWRVKEEGFLKDNAFVSELKLRVGYGITGQQDIGRAYGYLPRFQIGSLNTSYQSGFNPDGTPNFVRTLRPESFIASRKWEETTTYNAGIDYGFGSTDRVSGSVDAYYKRSSDLLFEGPIAAGAGLINLDIYNVGAFETKGIEFAVNAGLLRTDKLNWDVNFNATYNRTNIINLDRPGAAGTDSVAFPAGSAGFNVVQVHTPRFAPRSYYVYRQKYDDQGRPIVATADRGGINAYEDINGDGRITTRDLVRYQQPAPRFILGLTSNLTSGNAYLNFTVRSYLGNYNYNNVSAGFNSYKGLFNANGNYFTNTTPLLGNEVAFADQQTLSDYFVQDASFVRMENITVGYSFPKLGGHEDRSLGLSFAVQNAFVLTSYKGIDPEVVDGIDGTVYPRSRTYTVGLSLGF